MNNRTLISDTGSKLDQKVVIAGWLHRLRDLSKFGFAILRDRTGLVQVVLNPDHLAVLKGLQVETVLRVVGTVVKKQSKDPNSTEVEIQAETIEVLAPVVDVLPVEINNPGIDVHLDTLLDNRVVTLRHPQQRAIFAMQAALAHGYRSYMSGQKFTEVFFPILAGAASEGGAEFFTVNYYGKEATLSQSAQLYKQITMGVYEGVYGISYSFRAEKYATSRHITEFNQLEFELGFVDSLDDIIMHAEGAIRAMHAEATKNASAIELLKLSLPSLGEHFPRLTLAEALALYKEGTGIDETSEPDLSPAAEKWLSTVWGPEKHGSAFVIVTHYPTSKRPFYTKTDPSDPSLTLSFDIIGNGSEILTGGLRVNRYDEQIERIKEKGLNPEDFKDYLMMHKYGIPPEGGFGIGLQRLTQNMLGLPNIKEATLFPRDVQRLRP